MNQNTTCPDMLHILSKAAHSHNEQTYPSCAGAKSILDKLKDIKPDSIAKIKMPLPSLEEQERIVSILDSLYTLTNDLTAGLPAEIEKRRQQYEYYRDQLLTFKRAN